MTEIYFYHLQRQPLEQLLPKLLTMGLARGWRAVVQVGNEERVEALSTVLWTFDEESFLPHGSRLDGMADLQPIWLTAQDDNPNGANVRFYVDGAPVGDVAGLIRAVIVFDGADEAALAQARDDWKRFKREGYVISYWQQDEQGRWVNRAQSSA